MKSRNTKEWRALREPVTYREAAKLLDTSVAVVEEMVSGLHLISIRVRGRKMIPACELRRFRPSR